MNFKHSWTRRLKYVFPIMMMLGTLFGLKTANVFAEKVIVDPSNPIQNVKNNFIIPNRRLRRISGGKQKYTLSFFPKRIR